MGGTSESQWDVCGLGISESLWVGVVQVVCVSRCGTVDRCGTIESLWVGVALVILLLHTGRSVGGIMKHDSRLPETC